MRLYSSPPAHVPSLLTLCKKSVAHMRVEGAGDRVRPMTGRRLDALGLARRALHDRGSRRLAAEHLAARAEHGARLGEGRANRGEHGRASRRACVKSGRGGVKEARRVGRDRDGFMEWRM